MARDLTCKPRLVYRRNHQVSPATYRRGSASCKCIQNVVVICLHEVGSYFNSRTPFGIPIRIRNCTKGILLFYPRQEAQAKPPEDKFYSSLALSCILPPIVLSPFASPVSCMSNRMCLVAPGAICVAVHRRPSGITFALKPSLLSRFANVSAKSERRPASRGRFSEAAR